ncbi:hypothetical protein NMY22_g11864 [Coprinellus aureogranulatus]|nr:hypothetical protein NMY22_g11864 [Coprinellus aureogranulatus]
MLPLELWTYICSFADFDDGYTVRSLAQASHFFREAAEPYRLRTISLHNVHQVMALTGHLESLPLERRRVEYLFAASQQDDDDLLALADFYKPGICDRTPGPTPEEILEYGEELVAHAISRLLTAIRTTVRILHLQLEERDFIFAPIKFDKLEELTLQGSFSDSYQAYVSSLPANPTIRRLSIDCVYLHPTNTLFDSIARYAPQITHLYFRLRSISANPHAVSELTKLLYGTPDTKDRTIPPLDTTLEKLYIHPGLRNPPAFCGTGISSLFASKLSLYNFCHRQELQSRVVLLREDRLRQQPFSPEVYRNMAERQWLSRIHGGLGCWDDSERMEPLY